MLVVYFVGLYLMFGVKRVYLLVVLYGFCFAYEHVFIICLPLKKPKEKSSRQRKQKKHQDLLFEISRFMHDDKSYTCIQYYDLDPDKTKCNRQNCEAYKPSETKKSTPEAVDDNDQVRFCNIFFLYNTSLETKSYLTWNQFTRQQFV